MNNVKILPKVTPATEITQLSEMARQKKKNKKKRWEKKEKKENNPSVTIPPTMSSSLPSHSPVFSPLPFLSFFFKKLKRK